MFVFQVSNLFARDEIDEITQDLISVMKAEYPKRPPTNENLYDYFITRVKNNLHVVLCFSPVSGSSDNKNKQRTQQTNKPFTCPCCSVWLEFVCPVNQHPKNTSKKKCPQTFAHLVNVSAMFDNHTILLFYYKMNKPVLTA